MAKDKKEETEKKETTEETEKIEEKVETTEKKETTKEEKPSDDKEIVIDEEKIAQSVVEKLKINKDNTYTGEQVSQLLKEVGKNSGTTAKNQLYGEINRLKNKVSELTKDKSTTSTEEKEKIETEKSELKAQIKVLEDAVVEVTEKFDNYKSESTKEKLADYRASKIKEVDGKLVEEMVTGNTKEEIDASIEKAKAKFKEVEENVRKRLKVPSVDEEKTTEETEKKPVVIERLDVSDDRAVKEYKQNRKKILDDVYRRAGFPKRTF